MIDARTRRDPRPALCLGWGMASTFSRILTATTVLLLVGVLVTLFLQTVTGEGLGRWIAPLGAALGVLVLIRLLLNARSSRSRIAGPVMDSLAVQSRLYGVAPGSSRIEQHDGPTHTTSEVEQDPRHGPDVPPRRS